MTILFPGHPRQCCTPTEQQSDKSFDVGHHCWRPMPILFPGHPRQCCIPTEQQSDNSVAVGHPSGAPTAKLLSDCCSVQICPMASNAMLCIRRAAVRLELCCWHVADACHVHGIQCNAHFASHLTARLTVIAADWTAARLQHCKEACLKVPKVQGAY